LINNKKLLINNISFGGTLPRAPPRLFCRERFPNPKGPEMKISIEYCVQ